MKTLLKKLAAEWEKSLLWASAGLLTLVIVFQLSGLLDEPEAEPTRNKPTQAQRSYLNEATAFAFLQPLPTPAPGARNPFAFSCKFPAQAAAPAAAPAPDTRKVWKKPAPQPATAVAPPKPPPPAVAAPPPPPKRALTLLYRGVYEGGDKAGQQLAFVSGQQTPSGTSGTMVAAVGQAMGGVTVKSFTPTALVVTSPTGQDVTIEIGKQKKIPLE
jgi:hypothetical protein